MLNSPGDIRRIIAAGVCILSVAEGSDGAVGRKRDGKRSPDNEVVPFCWASVVINLNDWEPEESGNIPTQSE